MSVRVRGGSDSGGVEERRGEERRGEERRGGEERGGGEGWSEYRGEGMRGVVRGEE